MKRQRLVYLQQQKKEVKQTNQAEGPLPMGGVQRLGEGPATWRGGVRVKWEKRKTKDNEIMKNDKLD